MLQSLAIHNFRCFHQLSLNSLNRVNLIGGINNVGKTTVLEAIFLYVAPDNLQLPLQLNLLRGVQQKTTDVEALCDWLFYSKQVDRTVEIAAVNSENHRSELRLSLVDAEEPRPFLSMVNPVKISGKPKDLKLEYKDAAKNETVVWRVFLTIEDDNLSEIRFVIEREAGEIDTLPPCVFLSTRNRISPTEDVERFSKLDAVNRQDEILSTLRLLEPRLKRLSVLVIGGVSMIFGDIGVGHLVPLPLMGEGIGRLLSIVLAIANTPGGTVLIDEIENGLHYSSLFKIWQAIADAAQRANAQVFATSHSLECIAAAHRAFESSGIYDFAYHRLERIKDEITAVTYDRETISTSVDMNFEMR